MQRTAAALLIAGAILAGCTTPGERGDGPGGDAGPIDAGPVDCPDAADDAGDAGVVDGMPDAPFDAAPDAPADAAPPDACDPGAEEVLDGVDNDCDGLVDEVQVCATGTPFATIAAAIAAAPDGGTIFICAGTYPERLSIVGKSLHLISRDGPGMAVIDAGGLGAGLTIAQTGGAGVVVEGLTITNGASAVAGGGVRCEASTLRLVTTALVANRARSGGGLFATGCALDIDGSQFEQNDGGQLGSGALGGGALLVASTGRVQNSRFIGNVAVDGGGLAVSEGAVELLCNQIDGNHAVSHGGGLYHASDARVAGNSISENSSGWTGGGVHMVDHHALFEDNVVRGNTSVNDGGGFYIHRGAAILRGNLIADNATMDDGGGVRVFEGALLIEGNLVEHNYARDGGGGMRISHVPSVLLDNVVRDNEAGNTGGGLDLDNDASLVRGGEVTGNRASSGGGIFAWLAPWTGLVLEDVLVADNRAWRGGGLFIDDNFTRVTMRRLRVVGNHANHGGGLMVRATNFTLSHSAFVDNDAVRGGAVFIGVNSAWWEECPPCPPAVPDGDIEFVVFHANQATHGAAIWTDVVDLSVTSSILFDNVGPAVTVEAPVAPPGPATPPRWRYNSTWPALFAGMPDPTGSDGNLAADPLFVDASAGDFGLLPGSVCIDAGDPLVFDLDGTRADMGMFGGAL